MRDSSCWLSRAKRLNPWLGLAAGEECASRFPASQAQLKDVNWPGCMLLPNRFGRLPSPRRRVPLWQVRTFINGLTKEETPGGGSPHPQGYAFAASRHFDFIP